MPAKTRGQIAFEAYHAVQTRGALNTDASVFWEGMGAANREAWQAAALAVLAAEKEALTGAPTGPTPRPERRGILTLIRPPCPVCRTMTCTCPPAPRSA